MTHDETIRVMTIMSVPGFMVLTDTVDNEMDAIKPECPTPFLKNTVHLLEGIIRKMTGIMSEEHRFVYHRLPIERKAEA